MITNRAISPLIETAELQALVGSAKVVVIDCRFSLADTEFGYQQYLSGHIPGAFYLHLDKDLSGPISGLKWGLPCVA